MMNSPPSSPNSAQLPPIGSFDKNYHSPNDPPALEHLRLHSPSAILFGLSQAAGKRLDDQRSRENHLHHQMMSNTNSNRESHSLSLGGAPRTVTGTNATDHLYRFSDQINISHHQKRSTQGSILSASPSNISPPSSFSSSSAPSSRASISAITTPSAPPPISSNNIRSKAKVNGRSISLVVSPVEYQVVSYNIYPSPEVVFSHLSELPVTVSASLVCVNEQTGDLHEIPEGFTNGDVQVLKSGQTKVIFPALHLNRMTPIKTALRQAGLIRGSEYAILFRAEDLELVSQTFKLVSASNRIPEGTNMRPRTPKPASEMLLSRPDLRRDTQSSTDHSSSSDREFPRSKSHSDFENDISDQTPPDLKRRKKDEVDMEIESYIRVHVKGEQNARGFIVVTPNFTLREAREEILRSPNYPSHFHFWFGKMNTIVQHHQEDQMKASTGIENETLTIEPYEPPTQSSESIVMDLWLKHKEKNPLLPIIQVIRTMVSLNGAEYHQNELRLITSGINHFFVNTAKHQELNVVSLEDFKLFLKFFGPNNIFRRVLNVYGESSFHGFIRHYEAVDLLKGKPGYFVVRYSESQLQEGFYAFNVNKGTHEMDIVENYVLPYVSQQGCFIFKDKQYQTLREFLVDPDFAHILLHPLPKDTDKADEFRFQPDKNGNVHYSAMEKLET